MLEHKNSSHNLSKMTMLAHRVIGWIGSVQSLIVHTLFFLLNYSLILFGIDAGTVLLVFTTILSIEAIYMAIFIQMALNRNTQSLVAVEEDIDEIQEDVEEIQKDVDEIEKDVDEIQKDVDEIEKDIDVIEKEIPDGQPRLNHEKMDQVEQKLIKLLAQLEKMKEER